MAFTGRTPVQEGRVTPKSPGSPDRGSLPPASILGAPDRHLEGARHDPAEWLDRVLAGHLFYLISKRYPEVWAWWRRTSPQVRQAALSDLAKADDRDEWAQRTFGRIRALAFPKSFAGYRLPPEDLDPVLLAARFEEILAILTSGGEALGPKVRQIQRAPWVQRWRRQLPEERRQLPKDMGARLSRLRSSPEARAYHLLAAIYDRKLGYIRRLVSEGRPGWRAVSRSLSRS